MLWDRAASRAHRLAELLQRAQLLGALVHQTGHELFKQVLDLDFLRLREGMAQPLFHVGGDAQGQLAPGVVVQRGYRIIQALTLSQRTIRSEERRVAKE